MNSCTKINKHKNKIELWFKIIYIINQYTLQFLSSGGLVKALTNARFYNALSGFTQPIATYRNTSFTLQDMISENASHNGYYAIAYNNTSILGMCKLEPLKKYECVYLSSYIINPAVRGTGFNKEFLTAVLYHPRVQPYSRIELKVHEDNIKAYNTYKSLGFKTLSKEHKRHIMMYTLF